MAFETVELPADENLDYWNPTVKGESIEGNICGTETSQWDKNRKRMVLETPNGNQITLPDTRILDRFRKGLKIGDYIKVTYDGEKQSDDPNYAPTKLFSIQKDTERFEEYEE